MEKVKNTTKNKKTQASNFIGEYHYVLDEKGRLTVPTKFRSHFTDGCVVTKGVDACLFMFTAQEWSVLAERIAGLPMTQGNTRAYSRMLLGGAMDVELDKQSRIAVPEYLRTYAGLEHDVVIVGLYRRLELWDRAAWETYKAKIEAETPAIAETLQQFEV